MFGFQAGGEVARYPRFCPVVMLAVIFTVSFRRDAEIVHQQPVPSRLSEARDAHHLKLLQGGQRYGGIELTIRLHDLILSYY